MAKEVNEVADDLRALLNGAGSGFLRLSWEKFYTLSEIERLHPTRWTQIVEASLERGVVLGWGNNAVVLADDFDS